MVRDIRLVVYPDRVISAEAAAIKAGIRCELPDPDVTLEAQRARWNDAAAQTPHTPGIVTLERSIAGVACLQVTAEVNANTGAVVVYAHGGGLTSGSPITHREFASRLALATETAVLLVDYRLLPENPISAPVDDIVAVHQSLLATGASAHDIVYCGDSSGAAVIVSAAIALRTAGLPLPRCIVSFSGAVDATMSGGSFDEGLDPQLSRASLGEWHRIISSVVDPRDPVVSPLYADLRGLPPVLMLAGSDEVWRDDSVRLAERIVSARGQAELVIWPEMWHVWPTWGDFPESRDALALVASFLVGR